MYKYSKYNLMDHMEDRRYSFYNVRTQKHLVIDLNEYNLQLSQLQDAYQIETLPAQMKEKLLALGFIVPTSEDENQTLLEQSKVQHEIEHQGLYLTLLPTLGCNFRCVYCYENPNTLGTHQVMNEETQENIVRFAREKIASGLRGPLYVKWFGGEPLLAREVLQKLSKRLQTVAENAGNEYNAFLVTNGYMVDRFSAADIDVLKLSAIQITLDGPEAVHNKRRPTCGGGKTFERILANVEKLSKYYKNIALRINVDLENAPAIHELFLLLKARGIFDLCKQVSMAYVDTEIGKFSQELQCAATLTEKNIQDIYQIVTKNLEAAELSDYEPITYPSFLSVGCDALLENYYVIDPEGFVFKCTGDATFRERSLFNINTGKEINPQRACDIAKAGRDLHSACSACALLPMCQGGCPAKRLDIPSGGPFCWSRCHLVRQRLVKLARRACA